MCVWPFPLICAWKLHVGIVALFRGIWFLIYIQIEPKSDAFGWKNEIQNQESGKIRHQFSVETFPFPHFIYFFVISVFLNASRRKIQSMIHAPKFLRGISWSFLLIPFQYSTFRFLCVFLCVCLRRYSVFPFSWLLHLILHCLIVALC